MPGELVLSVYVPNSAHDRVRLLMQPGLRTRTQLVVMIDGLPRSLDVDFEVQGQVCPEPAAHSRLCDETDYERYGDCDGDVRDYVSHVEQLLGKPAHSIVLLCAAHAQQHGRHIRRPR